MIRRLALGVVLIGAAAGLLLLSDLGSRAKQKGGAAQGRPASATVALLQHASQSILEEGRQGMVSGMAERGWKEGDNLTIRHFNAEGDNTVSQAIAREMVNSSPNLMLTISTPSLQAVANANRNTRIPHVFGLVTNPLVTGVGITGPRDHPAWLAGFGSMQPVAQAFDTARSMNPDLKTVGVVWNAAEANAEAQVSLARGICAERGLTLLETTVDSSAGVGEAAGALIARGAEALWVCGDVTVMTAIDALVGAAKRAGIPVFTVIPPSVKRGTLFDLGADYFEVGRITGRLAGDILNGKDPATVEIQNVMPEVLAINLQALDGLKGNWKVPDALREKATLLIDEQGGEKERAPRAGIQAGEASANPGGKKWRIAVITYNETPPSEETLAGMDEGWSKSPLKAGKDYSLSLRNAQGDIAALSGIVDAALTEGADIVVPLSTPTLQACIHKIRDLPVVFSLVANPVAAGAGRSSTDHLSNVTGVSVLGPAGEMLDMLEKYYPSYRRFGTLFCPAETNSVDLKDSLAAMCRERGLTLEAVAANSPGELPDAALSMTSRRIDAVLQISDNLSSSGFVAIARAAKQAWVPLFSLNSTTVPLGAPIAMGRDYHEAGRQTVRMIERIIAGETPASIPFLLPPKVVRTVSLPNAQAVGMTIPDGLIKEADVVVK